MNKLQISMAAARVNAGMTQEDVARLMHLSKQTIVNWERGRIIPKPAQFNEYCRIVGIPKDSVFLPDV